MEKLFTYKIRPVKPFGTGEEIDTGFKGEIKVNIPDYKTRMKLVKSHSAIEKDVEKMSTAAYDTCEQYIVSIDLTHEEAENITSLDELSMFQEGVAIIFDVYNQILQGWSLSPKTVKS